MSDLQSTPCIFDIPLLQSNWIRFDILQKSGKYWVFLLFTQYFYQTLKLYSAIYCLQPSENLWPNLCSSSISLHFGSKRNRFCILQKGHWNTNSKTICHQDQTVQETCNSQCILLPMTSVFHHFQDCSFYQIRIFSSNDWSHFLTF